MARVSQRVTAAFWILVYGFHLVALSVVVGIVAGSMTGVARLAMLVLLTLLATAMVVGLWRTVTDRDTVHLGTPSDVGWDPLAYPGQAAKHRWLQAVRRLPEDEDDGQD